MNVLTRALATVAQAADHRFGWDKMPRPLGLLTLAGIRFKLGGYTVRWGDTISGTW